MRKGQLFTVGTPGDENTTYPDRLRRIVRIAKAGGVTTITQDPALPQAAAALGAANDAAIVRPATHVRARLATPGRGAPAARRGRSRPLRAVDHRMDRARGDGVR